MTREEANKELERAFDVLDHTCHMDNRRKEAFNMARVALSAEPCDCISRAELLKAVDTWDKFGCDADTKLVPVKDCYVPYIHYDDVVKAIKGMPSIQPKSDVLDKIRDEIERKACSGQWSDATVYGMLKAVAIVDKYTAEKK